MSNESKYPNIIWKCIHSLNPSNHIRPHRLVIENDLKVDNSIDIANTFNKFLGRDVKDPVVIHSSSLGGIANCVF
jgi:F0F1-type ATP synthase delta subunit